MIQKEESLLRSFSKNERMSSKKEIDETFKNGITFSQYPFLVKYIDGKGGTISRVLFSIPKKKVRKAVDRNTIRRRMREAYRLHKQILLQAKNNYAIVFMYISDKILPFALIEEKTILSLKRLSAVGQGIKERDKFRN